MASFQAKINCKITRQRENKYFRSLTSLPDAKQKIQKKQQKNLKNLKIPLWLYFNPKSVGKS